MLFPLFPLNTYSCGKRMVGEEVIHHHTLHTRKHDQEMRAPDHYAQEYDLSPNLYTVKGNKMG